MLRILQRSHCGTIDRTLNTPIGTFHIRWCNTIELYQVNIRADSSSVGSACVLAILVVRQDNAPMPKEVHNDRFDTILERGSITNEVCHYLDTICAAAIKCRSIQSAVTYIRRPSHPAISCIGYSVNLAVNIHSSAGNDSNANSVTACEYILAASRTGVL